MVPQESKGKVREVSEGRGRGLRHTRRRQSKKNESRGEARVQINTQGDNQRRIWQGVKPGFK